MSITEKIKRKGFNWFIDEETKDAQKKFGFQINTGKNPTWNNEADAFKHAFLSWYLSYYHGDDEAKRLGNMHEDETPNAPWYERNMDLWNNKIGREVAFEMKEGLGDDYDLLGDNWAKERAKRIIWEKMKKGELITNPFTDWRRFENMELDLLKDTDRIDTDMDFKKFDAKTKELRAKNYIEQIIDSDWQIPTKENLDKRVQSGELIYVEDYTRGNGTKVHGYYRRRPYFASKKSSK